MTRGGLAAVILIAASVGSCAPARQAVPVGRVRITVEGSTTLGPVARAFAERCMASRSGVEISVTETNSTGGARSLINGACDVAAMSRFPRDAEFKAAIYNGVLPVAHPAAIDAVAVIVHPSNPVKTLTTEQLRDIYTGRVTNWKELGGGDGPIARIVREPASGTQDAFETLVMDREKIAKGAEQATSSTSVCIRVKDAPNAVAYVGLGFVNEAVKAVAVNGVAPTKRAVRAGRYPLVRPLFLVTNGYPKVGSALHSFVTLALTPDGRRMVEDAGLVPVGE